MSETPEKRFPQFSLAGYLRDEKIDHREWESGDHVELALNCPMCVERGEKSPDTKGRLWVNELNNVFYCYNCEWAGQLPRLVTKLSNTTLAGALRVLRGKVNTLDVLNYKLAHDYERDDDEDEHDETLPEVTFPHGFQAFDDHRDEDTLFHRYLSKRGVSLEYAAGMGWGFSRIGYVANRIVVPTFMEDRLVFWQARDVLDTGHPAFGTKEYRKVLNPAGVSKQKVLYNFDVAKAYPEIIICEGFIDAAKAGPAAVAINGKTLHAAQVIALSKTKAASVCLLLDPDAFTDAKVHRTGSFRGKVKKASSVESARSILAMHFRVRTVRLPPGRDAGSYAPEDLRAMVGGFGTEAAELG